MFNGILLILNKIIGKSASPLKILPPPIFISELTNVMARAGQKVRLDCEVANADRLEWTHNGRTVNETPEIKVSVIINFYIIFC